MSIDTSAEAVRKACGEYDLGLLPSQSISDLCLALLAERDHAQSHAQDLYDEIVSLRTQRDAAHAAGRKEALEEAKTAIREACIAPDGTYDMRTEGAIARAEAATVEVACEAIDALQHQKGED